MQNNPPTEDHDGLRSPVSELSGAVRVALGLIQGLLLYALYSSWTDKAWSLTQSPLFISLVMLVMFLPIIAISAIGHLSPRNLLLWLGVLALVLCGLGYYDGWLTDLSQLLPLAEPLSDIDQNRRGLPSGTLFMLAVTGLFIAQALVLAGNADGKRLAGYRSYFEIAWKLLVQLLFAGLFTGLFWLVLETGEALFSLIKLSFLDTLIKKSWFNIPVTTLAFSFALHLSDVRPQIVAGIRKLLLTLLSWLLPMATLIVAGFLISILATGLVPLWQTRHASLVLLGATGLLVVLINTTYQDGNRLEDSGPRGRRFFTVCLRIACLLPTPLVLLAMYSLGLRVMEYGWTVDRISGAVCVLIAAIYALGYGIAAVRLRDNLRQLSTTNVVAAFALVLIFLALLTPLANPARIAVASQMQRLESGKTKPDRFDFRFLRFNGERYGVMALLRLNQQRDGADAGTIRQKAEQALHAKNDWEAVTPEAAVAPDLEKNIRMHPAGQSLPARFSGQSWRNTQGYWQLPQCLTRTGQTCDAYAVTPAPSGGDQLLLIDKIRPSLFMQSADGDWRLIGILQIPPACVEQVRQAAEHGTLRWQAPLQHDLDLNGVRLRMQADSTTVGDCPKAEVNK